MKNQHKHWVCWASLGRNKVCTPDTRAFAPESGIVLRKKAVVHALFRVEYETPYACVILLKTEGSILVSVVVGVTYGVAGGEG